MGLRSIDHAAIPIANVDAMQIFYEMLGFDWDASQAPNLYAAKLEDQKLNFHAPQLWQNARFTLRAPHAQPGCGDFCFVWDGTVEDLLQSLAKLGIERELGPVDREGGVGLGRSVYTRDPDNNLLEFISYYDALEG